MITVTPIPAFEDNYLWLISEGGDAVIVDPGDAAPVLARLAADGLRLRAILLTHHHDDHIGGVGRLLQSYPVPVYGPASELERIPAISRPLKEGDRVRIESPGLDLAVLEVPGHTRGHIAYFAGADAASPPRLFCGDTLFAAGCGRMFEGTPMQMYGSLSKFARLPAETEVYCAHEYTLSNLAFAKAVEPGNADIQFEIERIGALRSLKNLPSLPTTLGLEKRVNPFLRCEVPLVRQAASAHEGHDVEAPVEVFASLRRWKDDFRVPA